MGKELDFEWAEGSKLRLLHNRLERFYDSYPKIQLSHELSKHDLKALFTTKKYTELFKGFTGTKNVISNGRVIDMSLAFEITEEMTQELVHIIDI